MGEMRRLINMAMRAMVARVLGIHELKRDVERLRGEVRVLDLNIASCNRVVLSLVKAANSLNEEIMKARLEKERISSGEPLVHN